MSAIVVGLRLFAIDGKRGNGSPLYSCQPPDSPFDPSSNAAGSGGESEKEEEEEEEEEQQLLSGSESEEEGEQRLLSGSESEEEGEQRQPAARARNVRPRRTAGEPGNEGGAAAAGRQQQQWQQADKMPCTQGEAVGQTISVLWKVERKQRWYPATVL